MGTTGAGLAEGRAEGARRRRSLGRRAAFAVYALTAVAFLAASSAPTPLYAVYQAEWGLSPVVLTLIFAAYPVALMLALLTAGSLSDHLGRRAVLGGALAVEIAAMLLFLAAGNAAVLITARAVQGAATGAATAAFGAALVDLNPSRGPVINSIAPMAGMALGALSSSFAATGLAAPAAPVFTVLLLAFCVLLAASFLLPETAVPRRGALKSLAIRLRVPAAARRAVWAAAPVLIAVWAVGGFVLSLGPSLAQELAGSDSALPGGWFAFALTASGAAAVLVHMRHPARPVFAAGSLALAAGLGAVMAATFFGAAWLLYGGAVVAGYGFGGAFQGVLRTVLPMAAPGKRAELTSIVYVISYLSNAVPALGAGMVTAVWGLHAGVFAVGGAVVTLSLLGLAATLAARPAGRPRTAG